MAFDQAGEGGLRRRLRMAAEPPSTVLTVAQTLGVSVDIIANYLGNPDYVLTSDTYNTILTNLTSLPVNTHHRADTGRWRIWFTEKARWTAGDVAALVPPLGAVQAVVFVFEDSYSNDIAAAGPDDLEVFSIGQIIDAATGGNLDNLMTVVWYAPIAEYPY